MLILLSLWAFVPYVVYNVASTAFVNAGLVRVTAPITGRLAEDLPARGSYLPRPVTVSLIEALSPDQSQLFDLGRQHALARENARLVERQLEEVAGLDADITSRMELYRDARVKRLNFDIAQARAEKMGCLAELKQRREVGSRLETLTRSGLTSIVRSADALATQEAASTRCDMSDVRLQSLQAEHSAAQLGLFVSDGASDISYSQQQRERLALRRQELETQLLKEKLQVGQLDAALGAERNRVEGNTSYRVELPAGHVIWSLDASPGGAVTQGQTILSLANCQDRFVVVELPERSFERIKTGDVAMIRLIGRRSWVEGQVQRIHGSAARVENRLLAAETASVSPGMITVELALPTDKAQVSSSTYCDIGRLAEVRFERLPFSIVRGVQRVWDVVAGILLPL